MRQPGGQAGQVTVPPHPSGPVKPQFVVQSIGAQQVPLVRHTWLPGHLPQFMFPPQPSAAWPQARPTSAQVFLVQQVLLERQTCPLPHAPQSSELPQPSETLPHLAPAAAQVVGVQQVLSTRQT